MKPEKTSMLAKTGVIRAVLYALLVAIAAASLMVENQHSHSWLEAHLPFFWSFFAFAAAIVLILVSKWLAKAGLEAPPDSYDFPLPPAEEEQ